MNVIRNLFHRMILPLMTAIGILLIGTLLAVGQACAEGPLANAKSVVTWNANPDSDLAGYQVQIGTVPGKYDVAVDVGLTATPLNPQVTLGEIFPGLADDQYYLVVLAYDKAFNFSGFSNVAPFVYDITGPANPTGVVVSPRK